jgi:uncharacterized protein YciI
MGLFALTMVNGPAYDAAAPRREQDGWAEHAAFMDQLVEDGFVVLGGPIGDGERVLVIVDACGEDELRARLAADPWERSGMLVIGRCEPWTIWLDGTRRDVPSQP